MAKNSLNQSELIINAQIAAREALAIELLKATALLQVATEGIVADSFACLKPPFFWVLDDIIERATTLNEHALNDLLAMTHLK